MFCRYPFLPRSSMRQDAFWCGTMLHPLWKYQRRHAATRINTTRVTLRWILKRNFLKTQTRVSGLYKNIVFFYFLLDDAQRRFYTTPYISTFDVSIIFHFTILFFAQSRIIIPLKEILCDVRHDERFAHEMVRYKASLFNYEQPWIRAFHTAPCANLSARYNWSAAFSFTVNHRINSD